MRSGKQIKIIKHAERGDSQAVGSDNRTISVRRDPEKTERDVVSVVKEWVSRKKSEEGTNGFASLFGNAA